METKNAWGEMLKEMHEAMMKELDWIDLYYDTEDKNGNWKKQEKTILKCKYKYT